MSSDMEKKAYASMAKAHVKSVLAETLSISDFHEGSVMGISEKVVIDDLETNPVLCPSSRTPEAAVIEVPDAEGGHSMLLRYL